MIDYDKLLAEILAEPRPPRVKREPPKLEVKDGGRTEPPSAVQVGLSVPVEEALQRVGEQPEGRFVRMKVKDRRSDGVTLQVDYKKKVEAQIDEGRRKAGLPSLAAARQMRESLEFMRPEPVGKVESEYNPFRRFEAEVPSFHGRSPRDYVEPSQPHVPVRRPIKDMKSVQRTK